MNAHVRVGIVRQRVVQPYVRLAQHLQPSVKRSPSAPSPPDPGGRNAASPAGPSLTPGIARFTGAKASVSTGDRPLTRAILRRHGLAVKRRAEGCGGGAGGRRGAGWQGQQREKDQAGGYVSAAGADGAGPGGAGAPERARWAGMACLHGAFVCSGCSPATQALSSWLMMVYAF